MQESEELLTAVLFFGKGDTAPLVLSWKQKEPLLGKEWRPDVAIPPSIEAGSELEMGAGRRLVWHFPFPALKAKLTQLLG